MKRRDSLRHRLLRQFALLALLPLFAVLAVSAVVLLPTLLASGDQRNFELATAIRDQVQQQLTTRQRMAMRLAQEVQVGPSVGSDITGSLERFIGDDPLLLAAYITDTEGAVAQVALQQGSRLSAVDLIGLDQSSQPHYHEARCVRRPVWSETFLSPMSGRITAVLVLPFGERTLLAELALDGLSHSLADIGAASHTRAIILDRLGRVIGHPDPRRALQQENLFNLPLVRRAIDGQAGTDRITTDGIEYLAHALPVNPVGWTILVMQPTRVVLGPLITLGILLAVSLAITVVLALVLGRALANRSGSEVERLAEAAAAAATSQAPALRSMSFSIAEFQALWDRLRTLFDELHLRDRQTDAARRDLQSVLDAATEVAIVATDTKGLVTLFSLGAQKMLGRTPEQVLGLATPVLWHDAQELAQRGDELARQLGRPIDGYEVLVCHARHAGYEVRDWTWQRAGGQRIDVSLATTAMRAADGSLRGFLGVAVDISERRHAAELELARRTADEANQAKTEFLSRMSHELRTPLNAVLGYAQLMEISDTEPPSAEQRKRLQQIQRSGWHLVQMIDDVLDLTRIESGNARLSLVAVDLLQAIQRARELVAAALRDNDIDLRVQAAVDMVVDTAQAAPWVRADLTRLVQVLVNLLSNASKYSRRGGQVRIDWARDVRSGGVRVRIADDGIGMDAQQLAQLFQPFNRLGRENSAVPGTGIGLVITRRNLELMGGSLDIESRPEQGTVATLVLPAADPPATGSPPAPASDGEATGTGSRGVVLYIEDDPINARLMREVMRQRPAVQLLEAGTLARGLELARQQRPDLILLDMHLPDGQGIQAMERVSGDAATGDIPVVVVSADATRAQIESMTARGVQAYLTKPINVAQTLATLDRLLAARD